MYCSKCGNQANENVNFCNFCGNKFNTNSIQKETIKIEGKENSEQSWKSYEKDAKVLMFLIFGFWIIGRIGKGIFVELVVLAPAIILFYLTGKQIKKDTNSKWSYWCGILVIFFWGIGAYLTAKEFHQIKRVNLVGKILTIISYLFLLLIFLAILSFFI